MEGVPLPQGWIGTTGDWVRGFGIAFAILNLLLLALAWRSLRPGAVSPTARGKSTRPLLPWRGLAQESVMRRLTMAVMITWALLVPSAAQSAEAPTLAQGTSGTDSKSAAPAAKMPGKGAVGAVKVRGTVEAVDKEKGTVRLKGPRGGTLTLEMKDRAKLEAVQVGDPVVATYVEAIAYQVKKAGTAVPGVTMQETHVTSKPGETPAGAIGREVTVTATITAIDRTHHTVTIKGPDGDTETIKAKDPKNLDAIKVGDMAEITYSQALAISLDKTTAK